MMLAQARNYRKKLFVLFLIMIVAITILNHSTQQSRHIVTTVDGLPEKWDQQEWYEIKRKYKLIYSVKESNTTSTNQGLKLCDEVPKNVKKQIKIFKYPADFNMTSNQTFAVNSVDYIQAPDGRWQPKDCKARHRVAILIPYKNRLDNLNYFLTHMHPFLQRQELEYKIFVVEQSNDQMFNKGVLMNAGFLEIMSMSANMTRSKDIVFNYDCVVFHDVDLLPEDDRIMYSCPFYRPRHLSVAIDKYKYKMPYVKLIGGVLNFKSELFLRVNGYSNEYWGWGAEDDDMEVRLRKTKIGFERPNINIAHYRMLKHQARFKNPKRKELLHRAHSRYTNDGVNSVQYNLTDIKNYKLFTHIFIDTGEPPQYILDILNPTTTPEPSHQTSASQSQAAANKTNFSKEINRNSTISNAGS